MSVQNVDSVADFNATFEQFSKDKKLIAVFKGTTDPATGENWCGDCVESEPFINAMLKKASENGVNVLMCPVGGRDDWKGKADHPYRTDARLKLTGVPAVVYFEEGETMVTLTEGQCKDQGALDDLVEG
eukprot:CAMPEP_0114986732 /NCGR_PEP_ID=MMETSP0216-20121206/8591_1 /TAXON_ID=223996 /ORGANISM="Protocruzia adherens, Strain Boccale" /LENGTH=128 /DNA_ID=CAMNT_0002349203 /DNA_START=27 /DNA_END=413 /DNA_ORIENTATION=+